MDQNWRDGSTAVALLGMPLARIDEAGCIALILNSLAAGRGGWVITANLDILRRFVLDARFRQLAQGASLTVADGMPLVWASILRGARLPARVAGSDLIRTLSAGAARQQRRIYLVGGDAGTAEAAAQTLCSQSPGLAVAGIWFPPPGFEQDPTHLPALRQALRLARPDIVYVALGCPKQEQLIESLRGEFPGVWWIGVGISFSLLAGRLRRAPRWAQRAGMEWLWRLLQEPRRLAVRYLWHGLPFAALLLASAALARLGDGVGRLRSS